MKFECIPEILLAAVFFLCANASAADMNSRAGAVTTNQGRLNVRTGPSAATAAVTSLPKGSHITLISRTGDWWTVEYAGGRYGYCHADYITPIAGTPAKVTTSGANLNVRTGPGTNHAKTASLPNGSVVLVLTASNGWSRILYGGTKTGIEAAGWENLLEIKADF